jgi:transposase
MSESRDNEIIRRWRSGQSMRSIAADLAVNRKQVQRAIREHQAARQSGAAHPDLAKKKSRKSKLDAFEDAMRQLFDRYPNITVVRMLDELRRQGYEGGYTILRQRMKQLRPRPTRQPVVRFETGPGVQAQMDWSVYEIPFVQEGRRRVNLFSYVLSYSRRQYLCFTEHQDFETTLRQHIRAFEHLRGVAATCLYDNMKVVVQRWEDDQPVYNTRFLSFATHYGFRPIACRPRRSQTKGKVERPFFYVEKNLLCARTFRSLEHLNEVTRWWLQNEADTRKHRQTGRRPVDAHAEELPHLLPLPDHHYDTARVIYRVVSVEGFVSYRNNHYSVPWRYLGELLPVRLTDDRLLIYNQKIELVADHPLFHPSQSGQQHIEPSHRPPRNQQQQIELLRQRFAEFGEVGLRFLESLLSKQRCGRRQAQRALVLFRSYAREDVLAALERAIQFHAYSYSSLERILSVLASPKSSWATLTDAQQDLLQDLTDGQCIGPRGSAEYQHLLFDDEHPHANTPDQTPTPDDDQEEPDNEEEDHEQEDETRDNQ